MFLCVQTVSQHRDCLLRLQISVSELEDSDCFDLEHEQKPELQNAFVMAVDSINDSLSTGSIATRRLYLEIIDFYRMTWQVGTHGWRRLKDAAVNAGRLFIHRSSDLAHAAAGQTSADVRAATTLKVLYLLIQELSGVFLNVSLVQVGGEAH